MKTTTRNIAIGFAILLICTFTLVSASAYLTYRTAKGRLRDFKEVGLSQNPRVQFEALRRKYGTKLRPLGCTQRLCQYEIDLSNPSIAALRLVPYTEMNIWFMVNQGSLETAMLEYRTALKERHSPVVHVQEGMCSRGCGVRFDVNPHGTTGQMWNGLVEFDTRADSEQRDAALALNLGCFSQLGGCKDIVDLLPSMWAHTESGRISSRLVGLAQKLEDSHMFPSPDDF
jgi:hypothetical protein